MEQENLFRPKALSKTEKAELKKFETIILIRINNPEDMKIAPLGLLYIGASLKKVGYNVIIKHFNSKDYITEDDIFNICVSTPLFVGVSVGTGEQVKHSVNLCKRIKEFNSSIKIVWGGPHPTLMPEKCLKEDYIDFVVVGEGEETIVELANSLSGYDGYKNCKDIDGLGYKNEGVIVNKKRKLMENLDVLEMDWSLIDLNNYLDNQWESKRILTYTTSRGCCFSCNFCYNQSAYKGRWRGHSAEHIISRVNKLKDEYNIDGIRIHDDFFFADYQRAEKILRGINLPWRGEATVKTIINNPEIYKLLEETNCREIFLGLESGNTRILNLMNKKQSLNEMKQAVKLLSKGKGYHIDCSFIIGVPTETREEVYNTIDFMLDLLKITPVLRYTIGVYLPYPGTEFYRMSVESGFEEPLDLEGWEKMDRWRSEMKITWLDWISDTDFFLRIRKYFNLLPLKDTSLPYLKNIPEKRLRNKDFSHTIELAFLTYLQKKFANRQSGFRVFINKLLPYIKHD